MIPRTLAWIAHATGGQLHGANSDQRVDAVAIDTRQLAPMALASHPNPPLQAGEGAGPLFVAIKGENFDGHDHVASAAASGCTAALVSRRIDVDLPQVVVADTERALAAIAAAMLHERSGKVLAITGSNGKTSVKTMLLSILEHCGKAYANPGNRNNEIGLPLAVIDAPEDADFAIYEMGAGKPGDIAYLTAIAQPDVALVNNISSAHLERLGSLLGIADTKAAIYDALPADGTAVINADDAFAPYFLERSAGHRVLRFGLDASADITAREVQLESECTRFVLVALAGEIAITLSMPGRHNLRNALAATGMSLAVGANLQQVRDGLDAVQPVAGRQVSHRLRSGAVLIDDSYNANPGSLEAAIEALASSGDKAWLVLGDMRELGVDEIALHLQAGQHAKAAGIAHLYALGPLSAAAVEGFGDGARHFESHADLAEVLQHDLEVFVGAASAAISFQRPNQDKVVAADAAPTKNVALRILVKGSRGSAMDRIVKHLLQHDAANARLAKARGEVDAA